MLLCWFCPPLISTLEFRTKEEISRMVKTEEEYEDEMESELEDEQEEQEANTEDEDE